jgi:hypothetical protein
MEKKASLFIGIFLLVLGALALAGNVLLTASSVAAFGSYRLWPLAVIAAGLLFVMPPFFFPRVRGLGGLFVPGLPVLTTGAILLLCSLTGNWALWAILWPLEVLAVALSFLFMAIWMRIIWLLIPSFLIFFIGAALGFCALTGLWAAWAVLWVVVPLALGLAFLVIGLTRHFRYLAVVGGGFCALAGLGVAASSFIPTHIWLVRLIGPVFVMALGMISLALAFAGGRRKAGAENQVS